MTPKVANPAKRSLAGRANTSHALGFNVAPGSLARHLVRYQRGRFMGRPGGSPCESPCLALIDAFPESVYIRIMPVGKIQVGQVWKKDDSGESYLITKVYNEAIATFALLRKTGAEAEGTVKVKVDQRGPTQALPGFTYTQESDQF
jgi:hypothetical protein